MNATPWIALAFSAVALHGLGCQGGMEAHQEHASRTMARWADAEPTVAPDSLLPPADKVPAAEPSPEEENAEAPEESAETTDSTGTSAETVTGVPQTPSPVLAAPVSPSANPPDFLRPKPEKTPEMAELALELEQGKALKPGSTATLRFTITPLKFASELRVRYEMEGTAEVSPASSVIGASAIGQPILATAQIALNKGRSKLTAWAEGFDADGKSLFQSSQSLFILVGDENVLSGTNGYTALEIQELERQRDRGEIDAASFMQRMRILREAGVPGTF